MLVLLFIVFVCGACAGEDVGYSLNIGNAIDVFANYGDLSQVTQVISAEYEEDELFDPEPFREKNIRIFSNLSFNEVKGTSRMDFNIRLCDTFDDLLDTYFSGIQIDGTDKPWKAFMGDWVIDEIMRTLGIEYDTKPDECCYVLVRLKKVHTSVKVDSLSNATVKEYVKRAITKLNVSDVSELRKFMKSYGTHYIDAYSTGNYVYQVFKYKQPGYNMLKTYIRSKDRKSRRLSNSDDLRFYFSSLFLKQIGDIKVASGNKKVELWARQNLRDSQYLFSRPSLLRLYYNSVLAIRLNNLLDDGALLSLRLKTLRPIFEEKAMADAYVEIVENDMKLWEINA